MINPVVALVAAATALAPAPAVAQSRHLNTFWTKSYCGGAWQKCCWVSKWSRSDGCNDGLFCNSWGAQRVCLRQPVTMSNMA